MNFIDFSSSMTMIELVSHLLQGTTNTYSFYCGKFSEGTYKSTGLPKFCQYLCGHVRQSFDIHNIGIIAIESGDVMVCVTSARPCVSSKVTQTLTAALMAFTANSSTRPRWSLDDETMQNVPQDLIQITAKSMKEVNERIERLIRDKREHVNVCNILDFCGSSKLGCARADSVLTRRSDSTSHVAVRSVYDRYYSAYSAQ